ncbi:MAG: hypothetical protein SGARI_000212 [Bacillariaceae sp.]
MPSPSRTVKSHPTIHPHAKQEQSKLALRMSKSSYQLESSRRGSSSDQSKSMFRIVFERLVGRFTAPRLNRLSSKLRRSFVMVCAAFVFCFGALGSQGAHASTTAPTRPVVEQIVDNYVQDHMFDDDAYDPVESTYREAVDDRVQGTYPKALKEVTSSVLGQDVIKAEKAASGSSIGATLVKTIGFLRQKGLTETQAILLFTGSLVLGVPSIIFAVLMMIGAQNKRSMNRLMKKRYGETYTVDATIKVEEDVEAPDDDDEDDDEDEDEEDEDE